MQTDRSTIKAQEALQAAQELAQSRSHQQLDGEHVALAQQQDGFAPQLLLELGVKLHAFTAGLKDELGRRVKVQGSAQTFSSQDL